MKKYTFTTVDKLKPGDQFIKRDGDAEIVYTVLDLKCNKKGMYYVQKGFLKFTDMTSDKEEIIFLKHK